MTRALAVLIVIFAPAYAVGCLIFSGIEWLRGQRV